MSDDLKLAGYWWRRCLKAEKLAQERGNMLDEVFGILCLKMASGVTVVELLKLFKGMR